MTTATATNDTHTPSTSANSSGMKHFEYLKIVHYVMAVLPFITAIYFLGFGAWFAVSQAPGFMAALFVGGGLLSLAFGYAFVVTAQKVSMGEGRILATVMAATCLGQPIGMLAALYTLWVCWINEETRAVFDEGGLIES